MKIIILDNDGVINRYHEFYWTMIAREMSISSNELDDFFSNEFQQCLVGELDTKTALESYLEKWGFEEPIDKIFDDWMKFEDKVDMELASLLENFKNNGYIFYLATNQEKYRTEYLKNKDLYKNLFERIYSSSDLGFKKPQIEFFQEIYEDLNTNVDKSDILFFDDSQKNVDAANNFGFQAYLYSDINDLKEHV